MYLPTDVIVNIATVRHFDNLIKKTTSIVRITLIYDVKMYLNEIRCDVTDRIDTTMTGYWEHGTELRTFVCI
jgi:hypothetical protein